MQCLYSFLFCPENVGPGFSETSLPVYQRIGCYIPEEYEIETAVRTLILHSSRVLETWALRRKFGPMRGK